MKLFLTGITGYLGGYIADRALAGGAQVTALVRAPDAARARARLWRALELHRSAEELAELFAAGRLRAVLGDITRPRLGLSPALYERVVAEHDAVVHAAASLNRRSPRACFEVNLRGGLELLQLVRRIHARGGLRRFVHVSTTAVAGRLRGAVVREDEAVAWDRSDFDPYGRTKKFAEHLVRELLPDAPAIVVRPSTVLGDSRFPETTQFDMVRAFVGLARLPVLPFPPEARQDIVPADFVADAIAALLRAEAPAHRIYHLSAGTASPSFRQITDRLARDLGRRRPLYLPRAGRSCARAVSLLAGVRTSPLRRVRAGAALMDAFWPYLEWDVVFDNARIVAETGLRPASFLDTCAPLYWFAVEGGFRYPHRALPAALVQVPVLYADEAALAAAEASR